MASSSNFVSASAPASPEEMQEQRRKYRRSIGLEEEEEQAPIKSYWSNFPMATPSGPVKRGRCSEEVATVWGQQTTVVKPPTGDDGVLTLKVVMIGETNVGKTTFASRLKDGTVAVGAGTYPIYSYNFKTTDGKFNDIRINIWDSTTKVLGVDVVTDKIYFNGAHAIIAILDVTSRITEKNLLQWLREAKEAAGNIFIPAVVIGNKVDAPDIKTHAKAAALSLKNVYAHFVDMSCLANHNFFEPFLWLAKQVSNNEYLEFVKFPDLQKPETQVSSTFDSDLENQRQKVLESWIIHEEEEEEEATLVNDTVIERS